MAESTPKIIKLKSSDARLFSVKYNAVIKSKMIFNMLDTGMTFDDDDEPIPIDKVNGETMEKIIEWLEYHENDPEVETEEESEELLRLKTAEIDEWDEKFFQMRQDLLFNIVSGANFMDIKSLLEVSCKVIANMIKGKTPREIKETFHVTNSFTPEEIEEIKKENEWCDYND